ncbi:NAD-dependent epimerase/dehydratase family protein [Nonomuraea salmonea]|jgi:nucleoside-diphosphate-sugar epimerase|uniref:NAD-dependent epimerase/dehydratase family protein n=1 Tax=Nonomuraea salmonea TaxID=46181 RepID=A0ABV5NR95_9ACTN
MRVVVTGAHGKVGRAAVKALAEAGHEVTATDLARPVFERHDPGEPRYLQADLTDAGQAYAITHGADAVVHAAAIPDPTSNAPHVVFHNNLMATFNLIEAAVRLGVTRFVNISSETVPGFFFAERPFLPDYAPVDEEHPARPQDPYALSKHFGEQLMDAAVRRSDIKCISLRPSWVQHEGNYERNLGPQVRDAGEIGAGLWSYTDVYDLADAIVLAVESDLPGHEVLYIAAPDNAGGHDFAAMLRRIHGDKIELRPLSRVDSSGVSCEKAYRMLGWTPKRTWRDYLDENGRSRQR